MAWPKGNKYWKYIDNIGRNKIYEDKDLDTFRDKVIDYFKVTSERFWEEQHWVGKDGIEVTKNHPVPFLKQGIYLHVGINKDTWNNYKKREGFSDIITHAEELIFMQKFEGASTGFFNHNLIAKELGLVDKKDLSSSDGTMTPKMTIQVQDEKTAKNIESIE